MGLHNFPIILLTEIFSLVSISKIGLKRDGCAFSSVKALLLEIQVSLCRLPAAVCWVLR